MVLDHIGFNVADFAPTKAFLVKTLAPLGMTHPRGGRVGHVIVLAIEGEPLELLLVTDADGKRVAAQLLGVTLARGDRACLFRTLERSVSLRQDMRQELWQSGTSAT